MGLFLAYLAGSAKPYPGLRHQPNGNIIPPVVIDDSAQVSEVSCLDIAYATDHFFSVFFLSFFRLSFSCVYSATFSFGGSLHTWLSRPTPFKILSLSHPKQPTFLPLFGEKSLHLCCRCHRHLLLLRRS